MEIKSSINLLMIEDNPGDARLIREMLTGSKSVLFQVTLVDRLKKGLDYLSKNKIDIVLVDLSLPDSYGLDTLITIVMNFPMLPIIILTGLDNEEIGLEALKLGAQDYLIKGNLNYVDLPRAINYAVERFQIIEKLRASEERNRSITDLASDAIVCTDEDHKIITWNFAAQKIFGYAKDEILNKPIYGIILKKSQGEELHPDLMKFEIGEMLVSGLSQEVSSLTKDGTEIPVEISISKWKNSDRYFYTYIIRDITERKIAEERINKSLSDLQIAHEKLNKSYERVNQTIEDSIRTIAKTIEVRDPYTSGHQKRVAQLAVRIAQEMDLKSEMVKAIEMAAEIHDLGKIQIPSEILSKPGILSPLEFNLIKNHPYIGAELLKHTDFPWPLAEIIYQHHERVDGSGYPRGLKDDEIMLEAKIIAVADVVEAMSSHRPYRPALGIDKAIQEITEKSGQLYDNEVVEACKKVLLNGFTFDYLNSNFDSFDPSLNKKENTKIIKENITIT